MKIINEPSSYYVDNYLTEKYEKICWEILHETVINGMSPRDSFNNINFSTAFDKLLFVFLYEDDQYEQVAYSMVYRKLQDLEKIEVDFLFYRCFEKYYEDEFNEHINEINYPSRKYYYIANEFIKFINHLVIKHLSDNTGQILELYLEKLQEDIESFAYDGSIEGYDKISNYWEEFCFQAQYGDGYILEIILEDIEGHIDTTLNKASRKDVILLYTYTDEFNYEEIEIDYPSPLPDRGHMIENIVPVILEKINRVAQNTYVPDFSNDEGWDEED
jgi:hypothetical protein